MLVLSRRLNEKIVFPGIQTTVQVVSVKGGVVRFGIEAPAQVAVYREELLEKKGLTPSTAEGESLSQTKANESIHLLNNLLNAHTVSLALLRRQIELGQIGEMSSTLDAIESHFRDVQQRAEHLEVAQPRVARSTKRRELVVEDDQKLEQLLAAPAD